MAERGTPWSRAENEATVASYVAMLEAALSGQEIVKAEYNRALQQQLDQRSKGAVEYKYQNVSAVLIDLGVPYVSGYKPAFNYQQDLRHVVIAQLTERRTLRQVITKSVLELPSLCEPPDSLTVFVDAPVAPEPKRRVVAEKRPPAQEAPVDYLLMEARNSALGLAGEKFVLQVEQERLERAGKGNLAAKVSHVSVERGDGFGFDILSYETNSKEKLIEVKTTKYGEYTPFYVSKNELTTSQKEADKYQLYRVFSYGTDTKVFCKLGALNNAFLLDAASYVARLG